MLARKVDVTRLRELIDETAPELVRYPSIDPERFRQKLDAFFSEEGGEE